MPLSSIVTIVLRIFALSWMVTGLIQLLWVFQSSRPLWSSERGFSIFLPALGQIILGVLLAMWSRTISRAVTPKPDAEVQMGGLTAYDLYCFAFTFLGLYFVLSSIGGVINWGHYMLMDAQRDSMTEDPDALNFYGLTQQLITLLAGGACLIGAPRFARKLGAAQKKEAKQH